MADHEPSASGTQPVGAAAFMAAWRTWARSLAAAPARPDASNRPSAPGAR